MHSLQNRTKQHGTRTGSRYALPHRLHSPDPAVDREDEDTEDKDDDKDEDEEGKKDDALGGVGLQEAGKGRRGIASCLAAGVTTTDVGGGRSNAAPDPVLNAGRREGSPREEGGTEMRGALVAGVRLTQSRLFFGTSVVSPIRSRCEASSHRDKSKSPARRYNLALFTIDRFT
jgi:hypothetical protein